MRIGQFFTLLTALMIVGLFTNAQEYTTVSESRKESIKSILNYRYKGGYYTFEQDFNNMVSYPETAKLNCRLGICIASIKVDCEGVIQEVTLKKPFEAGN